MSPSGHFASFQQFGVKELIFGTTTHLKDSEYVFLDSNSIACFNGLIT